MWGTMIPTNPISPLTATAEVPIGVVTAFFGAPFFLLVLRHRARR